MKIVWIQVDLELFEPHEVENYHVEERHHSQNVYF